MPQYRISDSARLLGVSDDTVRRWITAGSLDAGTDDAGRKVVDGTQLARAARDRSQAGLDPVAGSRSARNRMTGLVTRVVKDGVMAQVEIQAGPHRVVSLMSREAADELALEPGALVVAVVKATNVIVETP